MRKYVVQFSGGLGSWAAAMRIAERHGTENLWLVFCDTLTEDEDLYRFLVEGAADVFGLLSPEIRALAAGALSIPSAESDRWPERKAAIALLREQAVAAIPRLVWLADGRHVWEIFQAERYIGNTRVDPCSKILKRKLADRWHDSNCDPADTVRVLGLGYAEQNRIEGVTARLGADGWRCEFPMDDAPLLSKVPLMQLALDRGIQPPRLYYNGFAHNNCGGFCCKAGQASMARLLDRMPQRYAYHERQEAETRDLLGKDVGILRDRRGGTSKTITLRQFRERIEAGSGFDIADIGACSCFEIEASPSPASGTEATNA